MSSTEGNLCNGGIDESGNLHIRNMYNSFPTVFLTNLLGDDVLRTKVSCLLSVFPLFWWILGDLQRIRSTLL